MDCNGKGTWKKQQELICIHIDPNEIDSCSEIMDIVGNSFKWTLTEISTDTVKNVSRN